tara:strand:- start:1000 stop:1266 length:267 start_codon:yes stop_codon:yes gene_type:complete
MSSVELELEECVGKTFDFGFGNIFTVLSFTNSRNFFTIQTEFGKFRRKIYYDSCNSIKQEGMYCYLRSNRIVNNDNHNENECVAEYII